MSGAQLGHFWRGVKMNWGLGGSPSEAKRRSWGVQGVQGGRAPLHSKFFRIYRKNCSFWKYKLLILTKLIEFLHFLRNKLNSKWIEFLHFLRNKLNYLVFDLHFINNNLQITFFSSESKYRICHFSVLCTIILLLNRALQSNHIFLHFWEVLLPVIKVM